MPALVAPMWALLIACGGGSAETDPLADARSALVGEWTLVSADVDSAPLAVGEGQTPSLTLTDEPVEGRKGYARMSGRGPCNGGGGRYFLRPGGGITVMAGHTEKSCGPDVDRIEMAYFQALERVRAYRIDGERVVLSGSGAELEYTRAATP